MTILITEHKNGSITTIHAPSGANAGETVERWQRRSIYYQVHGRLPAITWTTIDSNDIVDVLIAAYKMPRLPGRSRRTYREGRR